MKTKHGLFLVVLLLIPSVSFALVTVYGSVWIIVDDESEVAPYALVQVICEPNFYKDRTADENGKFQLQAPDGACQIRVILPGEEPPSPSTVDSVYFETGGPDELILELDRQDDQWYLSTYLR